MSQSKFVLLTTQRTGSTWVLDMLNNIDGVEGHQELFYPDIRRRKAMAGCNDYLRFIEMSYSGLQAVKMFGIYTYLKGLYRREGVVGFKLMYSHLRVNLSILFYLILNRIKIVHLVRENCLDILISEKLAFKSGYSHTVSAKDESIENKVLLNTETLLAELEKIEHKVVQARKFLKFLPLRSIEVSYESLRGDLQEFKKMCSFLGIEYAQGELPGANILKRQNRKYEQVIENYSAVSETLKSHKYGKLLAS